MTHVCSPQAFHMLVGGLMTETGVYGIYIALVAGSIYLLADAQFNRTLYSATTMAMFILSSGVLMLDLTRVLLLRESLFFTAACVEDICPPCRLVIATPKGLVDEAIISAYLTILTAVMLMMNQVIADGVLIFRCYVLWGARKWVVIPPLVGLLANIACMLASLYYEIRLFNFLRNSNPLVTTAHHSAIMFELQILVKDLDIAHVVLSLTTNILASALIIIPIWHKAKQSHGIIYKKYLSAATICLETGSLLSFVLIILLIVELTVPRFVVGSLFWHVKQIPPEHYRFDRLFPLSSLNNSSASLRHLSSCGWVWAGASTRDRCPRMNPPTRRWAL
ncbi:hypothetical protein DENSPDRAFT_842619 [Dentipellis sp. KUC8613]|nr:hypothetical protein DENSPDRAFT_842619 [Dentipellis sp. KUC8613]